MTAPNNAFYQPNSNMVIYPWYPDPWKYPWDRQPWNPPPWVDPWNPPYQPLPRPSIPMPKPRAPIQRKAPAKPRAKVIRNAKGEKETYITLILDKSGSMATCQKAALDALNEQLNTIRENAHKGGKTYVSLLLFSDTITVVFEHVPAEQVKPLESADYVLDGCTALRDAVNTAIDLMVEKQTVEKNQGFLSVLISDGQENASGTTKEQLRSRIAELERTDKWTFTYMLDGHTWEAMQEVSFYANNSLNNIAAYSATPQGTLTGGLMLSAKLVGYMDARGQGIMSSKSFMGADGADVTGGTVSNKTVPSSTMTPVQSTP